MQFWGLWYWVEGKPPLEPSKKNQVPSLSGACVERFELVKGRLIPFPGLCV
jgi:hypothetical protein